MQRVVIESPYAPPDSSSPEEFWAEVGKNLDYLYAAMRDCFSRNEAPFASHGLYTIKGVLDDQDSEQRRLGIAAGLLWGDQATKTVVYLDRGISPGMKLGIERATEKRREIEFRSLGPQWFSLAYDSVNLAVTLDTLAALTGTFPERPK